MPDIVLTASKAVGMMLGEDIKPELVVISSPGSSGARVSIIRDARTGHLYAVKCALNTRVSLSDEMAKREFLTPYLSGHIPKVLWCGTIDGFEVMISECRGMHTLHGSIINSNSPHSELKTVWSDVLSSLVGMWEQSSHRFYSALCPRYYPKRVKRIQEGVRETIINNICIGDHLDLPIVINGVKYPPMGEALLRIEKVSEPTFGVVCHGDPQPSNIMVQHRQWCLIDWEWSGRNHDWRMMFSHLFGWWGARCIALDDNPRLEVVNGRLSLEYKAFLPPHIERYQQRTNHVFSRMHQRSKGVNDVEDINMFLAALYFGEVRFLPMWDRDSFMIPMLAEGVRTACAVPRTAVGNLPFIFNPEEVTTCSTSS